MQNSRLTFEQQLAKPKVKLVPICFIAFINGEKFIVYNNRFVPSVEKVFGYTVEPWLESVGESVIGSNIACIKLEEDNQILFDSDAEYSYDLFQIEYSIKQKSLKLIPVACNYKENEQVTYL